MDKKRNETVEKILSFLSKISPIIPEILGILASIVLILLDFFTDISTDHQISVFCVIISLLLGVCISQTEKIREYQKKICDIQNNHSSLQNSHTNLQTGIQTELAELKSLVHDLSCPDLDACLLADNEGKESEIISNAKNELFLLQETGRRVIERNKTKLKSFFENGGHLSIIVCSENPITQGLLAFRSEDLFLSSHITNRLKGFHDSVNRLVNPDPNIKPNKFSQNINIRYCPYPIAITSVFSPDTNVKAAVVRHADFKVQYEKKLSLFVEDCSIPALYQHYVEQIHFYRRSSFKKILITGNPSIGKTTLIKEVLDRISIDQSTPIYYAYTEEILQNGERNGFKIVTSDNTDGQEFAVKNIQKKPSPYDVDTAILDDLAKKLIANKHKVLVFDEIGLLQFQSECFKNAIMTIFDDVNCTLIATITKNTHQNTNLERIKNDLMCELLEYDRDNHDSLLDSLSQELSASISMYKLKGSN